jgi:hypothetical protein
MQGLIWKPSPQDMRMIRFKAAQAANLKPTQIGFGVGMRVSEDGTTTSYNDLLLSQPADLWDNGTTITELKQEGVELNSIGEAEVDFYVYQKENFGDGQGIVNGELICNVIAHIQLNSNGKPYVWKVTT